MKYLYIFSSALLLFAGYCLAAEKPKAITLNDCINVALHNNQSIMVSEEDKKKALADYNVALAQRLIIIDGNLSSRQYPKTSTDTSDPITSEIIKEQAFRRLDLGSKWYYLGMAAGVTGTISLYNGKKDEIIKSAKAGIKLSKHQSQKVLQDVIFNVKKAYYAYINSKEYRSLRERLLKSNEERLKITQILYKNAQKPILDLSKAKLDYNEAQLELQKSKNNERATKAELFLAMGLEAPSNEILLQDVEKLPELKLTLEELNRYGENNYPDVQIIKSQKEINRIKVAIEKAGHYPDVDIQAGAYYENGGFPINGRNLFKGWSFSAFGNFVARIPIFSSGMVSSKVNSAESDFKKSVYKEKEVMTAMRSMIDTNYNLLNELTNQVNISKLMLENAEKHILLAKKTYESGAGTQLDLHDANVSLTNAQMGFLKAKYDYLMTIARLSSIVGLGEDALCKK